MNKYLLCAVFFTVIGTSLSLTSCKDEDEVMKTPEQVETTVGAYVSGIVREGDNPLSGVTVSSPASEDQVITEEDGTYTLPINKVGTIAVKVSKEGYMPIESAATVTTSEVASLDFDMAVLNPSVTLSPDSELYLEEQKDQYTSLFFPANSVSTPTDISITEYTTRSGGSKMGAVSVIYCTPDGLTFNKPVKVQVARKTSSDVYFANMKHFVENNGKWEVEGDMSIDPETGKFVGELTHFSNHAFGVEANWTEPSTSTELIGTVEIDNLGKIEASTTPLTMELKNGWAVDGDMESIVKSALPQASSSDIAAMVTDIKRMLRNAKGSLPSTNSRQISLKNLNVSGDTKAVVTFKHKVSESSVTIPVMFKEELISIVIPVKSYNGAEIEVRTEQGSLTPDHSGGNLS